MNLQKGRSNGDKPPSSPMIKSTKTAEREKKIGAVKFLTFPNRGSFRLIGFSSRNPLLPSQGRILSPSSIREEILFSLSTTSSYLSKIIFPFSRIISLRSEGFKSWKIR